MFPPTIIALVGEIHPPTPCKHEIALGGNTIITYQRMNGRRWWTEYEMHHFARLMNKHFSFHSVAHNGLHTVGRFAN